MFSELQDQNRRIKDKIQDKKFDSSQQKQENNEKQKSGQIRRIHFFSNAKLMSPLQKDIIEFKDFSTPIQIAQFSQSKRYWHEDVNQQSSPLMLIQLSGDIKKIAQKQNQESQDGSMNQFQQSHQIQVDTVLDLMGNKICQFNDGSGNNLEDSDDQQLSPIIQDKQNDVPQKMMNLNTPLKIRPHQTRSPLQDITPSMTHKKRGPPCNTKTNKKNKTSNKMISNGFGIQLEKWGLLTPRTMAESRMNKTRTSALNKSKLRI